MIPIAIKENHNSPEIIKYLLPFSQQNLFGQLFEKLETFPDIIVHNAHIYVYLNYYYRLAWK